MSALSLKSSDFLQMFMNLLPKGPVWPKEPDSVMSQSLATLMPTYERSTTRANNLLVDAFPATSVDLLTEWEETAGLPDPCAGEFPLISQRQAQVVARLAARGGNMSEAFYIKFAENLGYEISITEFAPFKAGQNTAGQPVYSEDWAQAWQVNAPQFSISYFKAGDAAGEPLATWGSTALQCELKRICPAHTTLIFSYGD